MKILVFVPFLLVVVTWSATGSASDETAAGSLVKPTDNPGDKCRNFGLLAPMFGISDRGVREESTRGAIKVTGPIASGLGGGYFWGWDPKCPKWTVGHSIFGWSEGLDPGGTFHVGVGGSIDLVVFGKFSFGLGVGIDLIRRELIRGSAKDAPERETLNGLLLARTYTAVPWNNDRNFNPNFTWLITFNVMSGTTDEPRQADKPGDN